LGSAGRGAMDEATCRAAVAHFFLTVGREESCGQCPPCRVGVDRLCRVLEQMPRRPQTNGTRRSPEEGEALLQQVERLARTVQAASLCGLGQTAPNPVLSTLRYFAD